MKSRSNKSNSPALAYSYIRFSHPSQAEGDSLRRQTEAAAEWCQRNGVTLDKSTTLHDLGRSAFLGEHRKNPDRNALAGFLKLVEQGKVPRGSFLLIENLDRLSREHIRPALTLLLNLIESGVRVVQMIPVEAIYDEDVEPMQLMMAIMELSRGHSESRVKSERVGGAWANKKERARRGEHIITHMLPAWVRDAGGKLELVPEKVAVIRRVFELARSGYGNAAIVKKMTADGVKPIGNGPHWSRSYVAAMLKDRRALGEFQPRKRDHSADGDPIPNYFPAAVSEEEWLAVRAAASGRRKPGSKRGVPNGSVSNLFAGMVTDARDGGSYYAVQRVDCHKPGRKGSRLWVLVNTRAAEGRAPCVSFPLAPFERAVLSQLREIDPREVLDDGKPVRSAGLAAELARVEDDIAKTEAELERGGEGIPSAVRALGKMEARRRELAGQLAAAQAEEANPVSAAWGEFGTLWDVLEQARDREHARRKLREALKRMVAGVWLLAVPRGRARVAAVRVQFAGCDRHRDYLIVYHPPKANARARTEARLAALSFASAGLPGTLDLRNPDHARRLLPVLEKMEL